MGAVVGIVANPMVSVPIAVTVVSIPVVISVAVISTIAVVITSGPRISGSCQREDSQYRRHESEYSKVASYSHGHGLLICLQFV